MRTTQLLLLLFTASGAIAGWLAGGLLPPEPRADELQTWTDAYRLERRDDPFLVSDGKWLRVLRLFPDFDLQMEVELGADMDLDLLVRHVEPRLVQGRIEPFTERFVALRLTTGRDGPPWRTREEALFGEKRSGSSLAPGMPATVWVQGRGRQLRANVAGRWTDWCTAEDSEGMFALVAHGGTAAVHRLVIENHGAAAAWLGSRWTWLLFGALGGLLVAAVAVSTARAPWLAAIVLAGWTVASVALHAAEAELEPLRAPPPAALALLLGAPLSFAAAGLIAVAVRSWLVAALAIGIGLFAWWGGNHCAAGLLASDTSQVDAVFGRDAGNSVSEAHAQLVRGPFGLYGPDSGRPSVFLLGGDLLYGRLGPVTEHLGPLLRGQLRAELRTKTDVLSLPTVDGWAEQQWDMFVRFYADTHRPDAIVFGVPQNQNDVDPATGRPRSWPSTLEATLRAARGHARERGAAFVMFTESELAPELLAVLRAAERDGVPLVVAAEGESPADFARRLASVLAPLLRR